MIEGSTPASAPPTNVAIGLTPSSLAFSSDITTIAAAPSLIPEALPAVTYPSGLIALILARPSAVIPALGFSSVSKRTVSFFFFISTGTISLLNAPSSIAFWHFCCELAANSSSSSLVSPHCSATLSAVLIMW